MSFEVYPTVDFQKAFMAFRSLPADMRKFVKSLKKNPYQRTELSPGIRKIQIAITSKGRGKSGGAHIPSNKMNLREEFIS